MQLPEVERIKGDKDTICFSEDHVVTLDADKGLRIKTSATNSDGVVGDWPKRYSLKFRDYPDEFDLLLVKRSEKSTSNDIQLEFIATRSPLIFGSVSPTKEVVAKVLHGIKLHFSLNRTVQPVVLFGRNWTIELSSDEDGADPNRKRLKYTNLNVSFSKHDGSDFSREEFDCIYKTFSAFVIFVRGGFCGIGNIFDDKSRILHLGFARDDGPVLPRNWYWIGSEKDLPELFGKICKAQSDDVYWNTFNSALNYYRAASTIQESSRESSLIMAMASLEILSNDVLAKSGGWPKQMLNSSRTPLWCKLSAVFSLAKIDAELFSETPSLREMQRKSGLDSFEQLTRYRNKIVHADPDFTYSGKELLEAYNVAMWLVEMLMFWTVGFDGEYCDRRNLYGALESKKVPFKP